LIVEKIWDSIAHDNIAMPVSHEQELDRRLERYTNGETTFVTWDAIKSELNAAK
jgi:putative addiction module component (TIGR02574 family)